MTGQVHEVLGAPDLAWLVERLRRRLELGRPLYGPLTYAAASPEERAALERLLGRMPRHAGSVTVRPRELEELLQGAGVAASLRAAVEELGGPVSDRAAAAAATSRGWDAVFARAGSRLPSALQPWLDGVRATGLLRRLAVTPDAGGQLLDEVCAVVGRLPAAGVPLAELAAGVTGHAHGLDADRPLGTLAVRAAASLGRIEFADTAEGRRDAWAAVGVLTDELSAPVLVLGLRAGGASLTGRVLDDHADAGEPLRLTTRMLVRHPPTFSGVGVVSVCENPSVVAAAADRLGAGCAPLVCLDGQRKTAARVLLRQLTAVGARLRYHGDFDWGGVRIANVVVRDHGAQPWRFGAADYRMTVGGTPLHGRPVAALWDEDLAPAMQSAGRAVHEELVIDTLVADLAG